MLTLAAVALTFGIDLLAAEQAPQAPVPAIFISKEEHEKVLAEQIAKNVVDQPIESGQVLGGLTSVATLHRVKAEASSLIHDTVTESYYILSGSGTLVTGGSLVGVGIDEATAVIFQDQAMHVLGKSGVVVVDPRPATREKFEAGQVVAATGLRLSVLREGMTYSLK